MELVAQCLASFHAGRTDIKAIGKFHEGLCLGPQFLAPITNRIAGRDFNLFLFFFIRYYLSTQFGAFCADVYWPGSLYEGTDIAIGLVTEADGLPPLATARLLAGPPGRIRAMIDQPTKK
jgi:hypothetical protein